jgi:hypothetical protein
MLYVGRTYTATLTGDAVKGVQCQNCGCEYFYKLVRTAQGQGSSPYFLDNSGASNRAHNAAQKALAKALKGIDIAPCPDCGWLQSDMVKKVKSDKYGWLLIIALIVIAAALFSAFFGISKFLLFSAATGITLFSLWRILRSNCKPNLLAAERAGTTNPKWPAIIRREELVEMIESLDGSAQKVLLTAIEEMNQKRVDPSQFKPVEAVTQQTGEWERKSRFRFQMAVLAVSAMISFAAVNPVCAYLDEEVAYSKAMALKGNDFKFMDVYLRQYPKGRHVAEVAEKRDHAGYEYALNMSTLQHTSHYLNNYLADKKGVLHREDAKKALKKIYTDAVQRLESLNQKEDSDKELVKGLHSLLNALSDSEKPTVTVSFESKLDALPLTEELKRAENSEQALLEITTPGLKDLASKMPGQTAILPPGQIFDPAQATKREQVILNTLRTSVNKACGATVVDFKVVPTPGNNADPAAAPAMFQINYHVYPSGNLSVWTQDNPKVTYRPAKRGQRPIPIQSSAPGSTTIRGLVRLYHVDWDLKIQPLGKSDQYSCQLTSKAKAELKFSTRPKDPDWALYVIVLHSAAHDFSSELIRKFGMEPPAVPTFYTMDGAGKL